MRIAFFTDTYLPNTDGVVSCICNYRKELESRGHEVYIFSPGTKQQKKENNDDHVYYFTSTSFKPYPDYRIALFNFFSPVKLVRDKEIDVIHSHGIATTGLAAIESSKKLCIPSVATFHTLVPEAVHYLTTHKNIHNFLQSVAWRYLIWYYSQYSKVLVPSQYIRKLLESKGVMNMEVLTNGINRDIFNSGAKPILARKKFGITSDENVVLYAGRIAKEKNLEMLIEASASMLNVMPKTRFLIVGAGPAETYYKDLVNKKGLDAHFTFAGRVDLETLVSSYASADVLAFPSRFDTQGLVVLEAMATGLPAVVHKETAPAEFIENGSNGYLFSDKFDFHEKLIQAIKNRKKLSDAALLASANYDIKKTIDRLTDLYSHMIKKKKE